MCGCVLRCHLLFASRRRHTRCALVTGVQTCALPICQTERLAPLADHIINEHFAELRALPDRYARWLGEVVERTARLIAQWQAVGFCHGVMNTDNMSILGLTLDYGPYGFLDAFDAQDRKSTRLNSSH